MSVFGFRRAARALAIAALLCASSVRAQSLPDRLSDATFWKLMNEFSEPWGVFRSENFVSNETSFQWIIPELVRTVGPGGVYLGVAPDQNFTYIVNVKPSIAFIVDIRRQNAGQHLLYKALIEMCDTRAEFLSMLFARRPLKGVATDAPVHQLFDALANSPPDSAVFRANLSTIKEWLTVHHGFALSDSEKTSLDCVYGAFFTQGPALSYNYASECRNPFAGYRGGTAGMGGRGFGNMPSFLGLMTETDSAGVNRSYLASENNYRALKEMEERNLIVPLTGNFAGDKALRSVGQWTREHGAVVTTFYVSNVEQYLFMQPGDAARFYANVSTLPLDSSSTFVRSASVRMFGMSEVSLRQQSGFSAQLLSSVSEILKAFETGTITRYTQVIALSHQ